MRIVTFPNGTSSIHDGHAMHSDIGPEEEARAVYLSPSGLSDRLAHAEPVRLWDVGMGIAANALAAIELAIGCGGGLEVHSFESRLDGLWLALENPEAFPWLGRHAQKVRELLAQGQWSDGRIHWRLHKGPFDPELAPMADIVFYDFYAPSVCAELWGYEAFKRLRPRVKDHGVLCTYSCSTAVRTALLLAGFQVGRGNGTLRKRETTLASPRRDTLENPLDTTWLEKLRRSHAPLPSDAPPAPHSWEIIHAAL